MITKSWFLSIISFLAIIYCSIIVDKPLLAKLPQTDDAANIDSSATKVEGIPFGTKNGLEELRLLWQLSQPTKSPNTRKLVIPIPILSSGQPLPEEALNTLPTVLALAEFYRIVEKASFPPSPPEKSNCEILEQKGNLPNGGILHLRVNYKESPTTAILSISGYEVPGYEQVKQIEMVLSQDASL